MHWGTSRPTMPACLYCNWAPSAVWAAHIYLMSSPTHVTHLHCLLEPGQEVNVPLHPPPFLCTLQSLRL